MPIKFVKFIAKSYQFVIIKLQNCKINACGMLCFTSCCYMRAFDMDAFYQAAKYWLNAVNYWFRLIKMSCYKG